MNSRHFVCVVALWVNGCSTDSVVVDASVVTDVVDVSRVDVVAKLTDVALTDGMSTDLPRDASEVTDAAVRPNARSPLGINLDGLVDWSTEMPLVDGFRMSRAWISGSSTQWEDGRTVPVDALGNVTSLLPGQIARTVLYTVPGERRPAGRYVVTYRGRGTIEYFGAGRRDAAASTPGHDVVVFDRTGGTFGIFLRATEATDLLRDFRVFPPGGSCGSDALRYCDETTTCGTGDRCVPFEENYATRPFDPRFLDRLRNYRVLRFMDWMDTNGSNVRTWADRPTLEEVRWTTHGAPVEIMVALANTLHADPWFCMPHQANDEYVRQFARYVREHLDADLRPWIEYSNEVWNSQFAQSRYAHDQGVALRLSTDEFQAQLFYYSRRAVQAFTVWEEVFGGATRLRRVFAMQSANAWTGEQVLTFERAATHGDALAIAPYLDWVPQSASDAARVRGLTLDGVLNELRTVMLPASVMAMRNNVAMARRFGLPVVAYEGGQHMVGALGIENDMMVNAQFDAANRDPRMGTIYRDYLRAWRTEGATMFVHFSDAGEYTKWGRWGSREWRDQPIAMAPKYSALQDFIAANPAWW
jgi:hypothetical protein